jgi:hypothetical protein
VIVNQRNRESAETQIETEEFAPPPNDENSTSPLKQRLNLTLMINLLCSKLGFTRR